MTRSRVERPVTPDPSRLPLEEAEAIVNSIRYGEVDALVVEGSAGCRVFTLHSADEPYRVLVEQMPEAAVVLDRAGRILYANARFADLVVEPFESLRGAPLERFVAVSDRADVTSLLAEGQGRRRARLLAGNSVPLDVCLSVSTTASHAGEHVNVIVSDLRELLEAQLSRDEARRDNRTKDQFLAMLAHELRSPLAAISAAAGVMTVAAPGSNTAAQAVIRRQTTHVLRLISDLLDVERMVAGKLRLDRGRLDLGVAVRRDMVIFTGDARFGWHVAIDVAPVWVDVDADRMTQVVTNLVNNAVKYTPPGGDITVSVRAEGRSAVLTVRDSGFGISTRLLPYVFDLYTQADRTLDRSQGGLGIGLTLVRRLVELHGGTVTVASPGENQGTTFTVTLDLILPDSSEAPAAPDRRGGVRRVLLVDSHAGPREQLQMMLETMGYEVHATGDGASAVSLLEAIQPAVGIIHVDLPLVDGDQVAERIRRTPHGSGMLLLALAGDGQPDGLFTGQYGFDHQLPNPVEPQRLAQLLGAGARR